MAEQIAERDRREDLRFGLIAAQVANSNPYRKGRPKRPEDFFRAPITAGDTKEVLERFEARPLVRGG